MPIGLGTAATGEIITRLSADATLTLALIGLARRLAPGGGSAPAALGMWTAAAVIYLGHVAAAFHFVHGWSHAAALAHTAGRTEQVVGISTGLGLWVNYAFTLCWIVDVAGWWLRWHSRRIDASSTSAPKTFSPASKLWRWFVVAWLALFLFVTLNATVIFETGFTRWYFVVLFAGCGAWLARARRPR